MYCSKCGSPNAETAAFCERCGMNLRASSPAAVAPPNPGAGPAQPMPPPPQQTWQPPPQSPPPQPAWQAPQSDPRIRGGVPAPPYPGGQANATGKNPVVALLLSLLIPGLGQFYNGDTKKGAIMLGAYIVSFFLWLVYIGVFASFGIWIWSMVDAHSVASGKTPTW